MSTAVQQAPQPRKLAILWMAPLQAASLFTVWAIGSGGETLRMWLLAAMVWLMSLPLLAGLEGALIAMMVFEPFRGLLRRAQYLFVNYSSDDPIHLVTPIVTLIAMMVLVRKGRLSQFWSTPLAGWVTLLAIIFVLEIFNPLQGGLYVGLTGAMFLLVPLVWFYFGQAVNEKFILTALRLVVLLGILGSLYGLYQLMFGYPAFEQYWIDNTDMYQSIAVGHVKRALATFSSAEEWGRYTEIGALIALGFFSTAKGLRPRIGWLACAAALVGGVLLSGQRTAIFGFIVGVVALIMFSARTWRSGLARVTVLLIPMALLFVLAQAPTDDELWSKAEDERVSAVLTHTQRGTLKPTEEDSLQIRFRNWGDLITSVIPYRPLGAGIGAGSLGDARSNRDFDLPPIDNFILVLAISCGIPGALVFVWILLRASWLAARQARTAEAGTRNVTISRINAAIMPALILNSVFGLTFSIYSVAPVAWLLIGWVSAEALRVRENTEREVLVI
ncbi:MAG TPA: O-antigen ligase family protein [Pyrinomonadaceae bacterium]|nr:O-antigen ligase family protein [Pyrinomonadaceae bacterium]